MQGRVQLDDVAPAARDVLVDPPELHAADGGVQVRHLRVAPEERVDEMLARPLAEVAHGGQPLREGGVVGDDHAALHRGDDLVRIEAEAADVAGGAHAPAAVARARRLARVLDDGEAAPARQRDDGIHVRGMPEQVHGQDRARARRERRLQRRGRHVVGLGVDLREDGPRPGHHDRVRRGDARQRRRHHLVARPHAEGHQRHVQRRRAGVGRDGGGGAAEPREPGLQLAHPRALGDPAALHHRRHRVLLRRPEIGPRDGDTPSHPRAPARR